VGCVKKILFPINWQVALKEPLLNPSGPGDFLLEIEDIVVLISFSVKGA